MNAGSDVTLYAGYAPLSCANLTATATGTAPFSYNWSNGSTGASITVCNTTPTVLTVTVTDANGCSSSDQVNVSVVNVSCGKGGSKVMVCHRPPGNPSQEHTICISSHAVAAHLAHGDVLGDCQATPPPTPCTVNLGNDTAICSGSSLVLNAGSSFTSYTWSDSSTGQTLSVTQSGTYWVRIMTSTGCIASDTIVVTVFNAPAITLAADSLPDSLGCRTIIASVSSGLPPYSFLWNSGDTSATIEACDSTVTSYTVTVTDSNGCTSSATISISPPISCAVDLGNDTTLCASGLFILDAGAGFATYLWSDNSTSQTLSVSQSGTYWVQVTNAATGCLASDTIVLVLNAPPLITLVADSVPDSLGCRNITASIASGTPPFALSWNTGDTTLVINVCDTVTTTYILTVIDSNGCSATDSVVVQGVLVCTVDLGNDTVSCGNLLLDAGSGFDTYLWSDSTMNQTLLATQSGTYWVQVTDSASGCTAGDTIVVSVSPSPAITLVADSLPDSLGCRNITVLVTTGQPPFTYLWSNGDSTVTVNVCDTVAMTYSVTVTDSNGCSITDSIHLALPCHVSLGPDTSFCAGNTYLLDAGPGFLFYVWSDSATTQTLVVSQSGTYYVTVSDSTAGCVASDTVNILFHPLPSVSFVLDTLIDSLGCRNLEAIISGGTAPYAILWNTGDTLATISVCDSVNTWYYATVTDSNGCPITDSILVTKAFTCTVNLGNDTAFCSGDTLILDPGLGFLTYVWSDSSTAQTLSVTQSGTYWVSVSDSTSNCIATDSITITVNALPLVDLGSDTTRCDTGAVLLDAGTGFASYLWSDSSTAQTLAVTQSGSYWVLVSDSIGCQSSDTINLVVFNAPFVTAVADTVADSLGCFNINVQVAGGTAPFTYSWSNGDTTASIYVCDTVPTLYVVTVTDSNGCISVDSAMVNDTSSRPMIVQRRGTLQVYPNPVLDNARISFAIPETGRVTLELYDMKGTLLRRLYTGSVSENTTYTVSFESHDLLEGVYMLRITPEKGRAVNTKFVLFKY